MAEQADSSQVQAPGKTLAKRAFAGVRALELVQRKTQILGIDIDQPGKAGLRIGRAGRRQDCAVVHEHAPVGHLGHHRAIGVVDGNHDIAQTRELLNLILIDLAKPAPTMRIQQHRKDAGAADGRIQIAVAVDQIDMVEEEIRQSHPIGDGRADHRRIAEPAHRARVRGGRGRIPDLGHDLAPVAGEVGIDLLTVFVLEIDDARANFGRPGWGGQIGHRKRPAQKSRGEQAQHRHGAAEDLQDARWRERAVREHGGCQRDVAADEIGRQHLPAIAFEHELDDHRADGQDGEGHAGARLAGRGRSQTKGENQEGQEDEDDFEGAHCGKVSTNGYPPNHNAPAKPGRCDSE